MSSYKLLLRTFFLPTLFLSCGLTLQAAEIADTVVYIYEPVKVPDESANDILKDKASEDWRKHYPSYSSPDELQILINGYINGKDPLNGLSKLQDEWPLILNEYGGYNAAYVLLNTIEEKISEFEFDIASRLVELGLSIPADSYSVYSMHRNELLLNKVKLLRVLGNYQECIATAEFLLNDLVNTDKERELAPTETSMKRELLETIPKIYYELGNFDAWAKYEKRYLRNELNRTGYMSESERGNLTKALEFFENANFSGDWKNSMERFMGLMFDDEILGQKLQRLTKLEEDRAAGPMNLFVREDLADVYLDLSYLYYFRKDYIQALDYAKKAVGMLREAGKKADGNYNMALEGLAKSHLKLGQWNEAVPVLKELIQKREAVLGADHLFIIGNKQQLAKSLLNTGDKKAVEYAEDISRALKSNLRDNFAYMSADERKKFWDINSEWFFESSPMIARTFNTPRMRENAYDGLLLGKGLLLNTERELRNLIEESGDPRLLEKYNRQRALKAQLSAMDRSDRNKGKRKAIQEEMERLEKELISESKAFGDYTANMSIGWKDVRDNLKHGEAAVEFLAVTDASTGKKDFIALVVKPGSKSPELVELFSSEFLDSLPTNEYYTDEKLYNKIWGPLENYLKGISTVYFAPDDNLHTIAIEYLPTGNGREIASDRKRLVRLSSTRQLAKPRGREKEIRDAALYGDILYNDDTQLLGSNGISRESDNAYLIGETNDNVRKRFRSLSESGKIKELPGTKREIEEIDTLLRDADVNDAVYSGAVASETSFKELSGKEMGLIHVATHGFYLSPKLAEVYDYSFLQDIPTVEDEALNRSGLFFAGAANVLNNLVIPEGTDDGVLTARELAFLDFRGLDLAVLSACQTALGDISGEGVFGLQRGFKKAGANSLLMSLWKVDDEATQLLMTEFYRNLTSGKSKYDSLQAARDFLRNYSTVDAQGLVIKPYDHPQFWGAFILLDAPD